MNELINWEMIPDDPIFKLTFPQRGMLKSYHFNRMQMTLSQTDDKSMIKMTADGIRRELNPHPAGQKELNIPKISEGLLYGCQHKYTHTILWFPSA